jgi:putative tryptophan/tyrosine transport system substrate-binding protein
MQANQIIRRQFMSLLGSVTLWPVAVAGQQSAMRSIGIFGNGSAADTIPQITAFQKGLNEHGYIEGKNIQFEYRWAEGHNDRLPGLAAALVQQQVALILTVGGTPPALAAKAATNAVPVLFSVGTDPVAFGLVASLSRPGSRQGETLISVRFLVVARLRQIKTICPSGS